MRRGDRASPHLLPPPSLTLHHHPITVHRWRNASNRHHVNAKYLEIQTVK